MTRRALVLGAAGFMGHHLVRRLVTHGWEVTAVVRDPDLPHIRHRTASWQPDAVDIVRADAGDAQVLRRLVAECTAVFPFAGQSGAARSVRKPLEDLHANVQAQLTLLEVLRLENPAARVVHAGSRLQYGVSATLPVHEEQVTRPTSIYGLHKQVSEGYHRLYHQLHGLPTTCLRITNPYGARQDRPDRAFGVVGNFLSAAQAGQTLQLWGGGTQLRDYVYIDDVINLVIACVTDDRAVGRIYNAGSGVATSLASLAATILKLVGRGRVETPDWPELERGVETGDFVADISAATHELQWRPQFTLEQGLRRTLSEDGR